MKKWLKCFYLCCFLFLSLFILTEASMSGGDSSRQSGVLAFLLDHGAKEATLIEPESLSLTGTERIYVGESTAPSLAFTPSQHLGYPSDLFPARKERLAEAVGQRQAPGLESRPGKATGPKRQPSGDSELLDLFH
jgi:hypothetical protein